MSDHNNTQDRPALRVYMTGGCDGAETLRASLEAHPDVEFVGASEDIKDASGALAGGHLQVVLYATRASSLPADELASIREHTRAPVVLVKAAGKKPLLLDLDLQFGDAAIMLGVEPDKTIFDLVVAPGELDSEKLSGYTTHHPCGLEILPAPLRPEDAELVTEAKLARL